MPHAWIRPTDAADFQEAFRESLDGTTPWEGRDWLSEPFAATEHQRLAVQQGWALIAAPDSLGGLGLGLSAAAGPLLEQGRHLLPSWVIDTVALWPVLLGAVDEETLPPDLAARPHVVARCVDSSASDHEHRASWVAVPDAGVGVVVFCPSQRTVRIYDAESRSLSWSPTTQMDESRRFADLVTSPDDSAEHTLSIADATTLASSLESVLLLATGIDSLGAASRALELGIDHANHREQFGRKIGSFQAVKHQLVDAYLGFDCAWAACLLEARSSGAQLAIRAGEVRRAAYLAQVASLRCLRSSMQVHGGMGFTRDVPLHLLLRRVVVNSARVDGPGALLDELAGELRVVREVPA